MEKTWGPPVSSGELLRSVWTGGTHGTGCIPYRHAQATAKIVSRKHATIPGTLQWFLLRVPRSTLIGTCWHHFALLSLSRNLSNCATSCAGSKQMWKFQKTGRGYPKNIHFMRIFKYQPTSCPAVGDPSFLEPPRIRRPKYSIAIAPS